ncbi:MAG: YHS domain-containing protein [Phycisphaerales bacterium]|nr:YHS domain-containing protein [Phycisphaerales bacterium]
MTRAFLIAVLASLLAGPRVRGQDTQPEPPPGVLCPVTPEEPIDPAIYTDYKGKRVYFCCRRCLAKFKKEPEKYAVLAVSAPAQDADHATDGTPPAQPAGPDEHEDEPAGHDHAAHAEGTPGFVEWLGNFHPAATDFPVALLSAAFVAEMLFLLRREVWLDHAGRFCIWGAAITGVITAALGWCFAGFRLVDPDRMLMLHRWLGTGAAVVMVAVVFLSERARATPEPRRGAYRAVLTAGALLVLVTAFLGGAMVWGLDHYKLPW